jgi:hypothetical protein
VTLNVYGRQVPLSANTLKVSYEIKNWPFLDYYNILHFAFRTEGLSQVESLEQTDTQLLIRLMNGLTLVVRRRHVM